MKDEYKFAKYTFSKTSKVLSEENTCFQEFQGYETQGRVSIQKKEVLHL